MTIIYNKIYKANLTEVSGVHHSSVV